MAKKRTRGSARLPAANSQQPSPSVDLAKFNMTKQDVVKILLGYQAEARANRMSGPSSREVAWWNHVDLYWNRFNFTKKASWQAREVMPEVPQFVDRFAASMREALTSAGDWYTVEAPNDDAQDLANALKKLMNVWLARCGRDALGHVLPFDAVFEELMKLGALMMADAIVVQKGDGKRSYTAIEPLDPRTVWLDTSGRNLYRIRRYEIEKGRLVQLARSEDADGKPIYDLDEIEALSAQVMLKERWERQRLTGEAQIDMSTRTTITLDEYVCTLVSPDGKIIGENLLCVVANDLFLIRGPEENPMWHGGDWMVATPLVVTPLSVYGKSYAENFAQLASTFNELTNLILDGTFTTAMKAFAADPAMLDDPTQLDEGIWPNKIFKLAEGALQVGGAKFLQEIDLGQLPPEAIQVWQALKGLLQEAASQNDITMGQSAPKGRTSSAEIQSVQTNAQAPLKSLARTTEQRLLEPLLNLFWKTALQHMRKDDKAARLAIGDTMYDMIYQQRKAFVEAPITFHVSSLSALIARMQRLQQLMSMLQVIAQNQLLMQDFLSKVSMDRLLMLLFKLFDVDIADLQPTEREQLISKVTSALQPGQTPAMAPGAAQQPGAMAPMPMPTAGPMPHPMPGAGAPPGHMAPIPHPNPVAATHVASPVTQAAPVPKAL